MTHAMRWLTGLVLAGTLVQAGADALEEIQDRGVLRCGVNGQAPGLSYQDAAGAWSGLDVDFCRAVAAAALGSADKVEFIPVTLAERFPALRGGRVDLLARNVTWTESRDLGEGISFTAVLYFDGQGFMVPRGSNKRSTLDLDKARICALEGATSPENAKRYFTRHQMAMQLRLYPDMDAAKAAYIAGECDTLTSDQSQLYSLRASLADAAAHRILPEVVSKEPLGPAVRKGETRLFDLVRWTLFTLIDAEEKGIDSGNVVGAKERASSEDVRMLLDLDGESAAGLGIEAGWGYRVIAQVGNYAELFDRNLGKASGLGLKRGLNALWSNGGLLYAPPAR